MQKLLMFMTDIEINILKNIEKEAETNLKSASCQDVDAPLYKLVKAKESYIKKFKGIR